MRSWVGRGRVLPGVLALLLGAGLPMAGAQEVPVPKTPAGEALGAWLAAFDSMDRAKVEQYVALYEPHGNADGMLGFARAVGGFTLERIEVSEPAVVRFLVRDGNGMHGAGSLRVKTGGERPEVLQVGVQLVPNGARLEWAPIDAAERRRVIAGAGELLTKFYTDPNVAAQMRAAVESKEKSGAYSTITDGELFARQLGEDLRAVSHDGHLGVDWSPVVDEGREDKPEGGGDAEAQQHMLEENCGFERLEVLPHNIGYVKFNYFGDAVVCGAVASTAMSFVSHTDAVIFDLRENHGGDPRMVSVVASWLFDGATHLNDLVNRQEGSTTQYWTQNWVPGTRMSKQPVYVLTSHGTFSGGEEFTYDLQTQKRAVIVGETTGGGAHPVSGHRIDAHFSIGVPFAHPVNPVTGKDWEGTGVVPDVAVPAKDALEKAKQLADERLLAMRKKP